MVFRASGPSIQQSHQNQVQQHSGEAHLYIWYIWKKIYAGICEECARHCAKLQGTGINWLNPCENPKMEELFLFSFTGEETDAQRE